MGDRRVSDRALPSPRPFASAGASQRTRAFHAAALHSGRVRVLRRAMMGGAVAVMVAIVAFAVFDPFGKSVSGLSVSSVGVDGSKVTMARPRLSGYRSDGRPYEIVASSAVQDLKVPTKFELHDMDARLTMLDKSVTHVTAALGTYDSSLDLMELNSAVHITSDSGLDVRARDAHVEFKSGAVTTANPVTVAMRGDTIEADSMRMIDSGKQVTFEGHVRTTILPGEAPQPAKPDRAIQP